MYYRVYLDVLFLVNFFMDFFLIFYVKKLMKISYTWKKTFLGAGVGAAGGCLLVLAYGIPGIFKLLFSYLGLPALMVWTGFPGKGKKGKCKRYLVLMAGSFFLGGLNFFLQYKWSLSYIKSLIFSIITAFLMLEIVQKIRQIRGNIYRVKLLVSGETLFLKGLYDTGNLLVCPWNGKEVHIVDETCLEPFLKEEERKEKLPEFQIPFSSVGKNKGMLRAVQISAMTITGEDGIVAVKNQPIIGLGSRELFEKKSYQIILHSRSF